MHHHSRGWRYNLFGVNVPTLADVFSAADSFKRRLTDTAMNPIASFQQMVGNANDQARNYNQQLSEATQEPGLSGPKTMELARNMANSYSPIGTVEYKGSHVAPNAKVYGATLDDLSKIMPAEVYSLSGKRIYGIGEYPIDSEWHRAATKAKGKPEAQIDVYRAVPSGIKDINHGDWVTTSPTYAKWHGENVLNGDYDIVKKTVKAKELSSEGYPYEFGWHDEELNK